MKDRYIRIRKVMDKIIVLAMHEAPPRDFPRDKAAEFCAPSLDEAFDREAFLVPTRIIPVTTMMPAGVDTRNKTYAMP